MMIDDSDISFDSAKPFMRGSQVMVPLETVLTVPRPPTLYILPVAPAALPTRTSPLKS